MLCTNCNKTRAANEAPCQYCGAPSSLLQISQEGSWGMQNQAPAGWNSGIRPAGNQGSGQSWNSPAQMGYGNTAAPPPNYNQGWSQEAQPSSSQSLQLAQPEANQTGNLSLLPVPYRGGAMTTPDGRQPTMALQVLPDQVVEQLLPAQLDAPQELTYVPPHYTKPRPITPRYRAVSGLLSMLIVTVLACGGLGYFLHSTGRLSGIEQFFLGRTPPPNITNTGEEGKLPDPPADVLGPAQDIIPSAALAARVNEDSIPIQTTNEFTVGQTINVAFSINVPPEGGTVFLKWYTNDQLFNITERKTDDEQKGQVLRGHTSIEYHARASGYVEIFWNDELAHKLHFVVR